jgi:RNA polymerase sigma-54 factor
VAARDLTECLRLQLRNLGLEGSPTDVMVRDHMKQLQSHQYPEIGRQMGLSPDEVSHHLEIIKRLDPKPGLKYSPDKSSYVIPDVFVVKEGDDYKIVLNDDGLPKLRISPTYRRMLDVKEVGGEETRNYVKEKLRSALWLLKSVDQRQRTIYKVSESIIRHQRGFLDSGITHLRPLVLRDVATDIGMHESTVSRVTTAKYVHTPQGIFELKYFFNSSIARVAGDDIASEAVKNHIKLIVAAEDAKSPYSDQKIVELLRSQGIDIARRTVAKYREVLGVLPSSKRKRYY